MGRRPVHSSSRLDLATGLIPRQETARGTEPILGVTDLESVGITIDTTNQTLKRLPAIPLKRAVA